MNSSLGFRVSPLLTGVSSVGMRPYLNNRLDCRREGEEVNVGGRPSDVVDPYADARASVHV